MYPKPLHVLSLLFVSLALCSCLAQSNVQASYMNQQTECQALSRVVGDASPGAAEAAPVSVSQFAQCMHKAGWHVAIPKAPAPAAVQAQQAPVAQQPAQAPVQQQATVQQQAPVQQQTQPEPAAPANAAPMQQAQPIPGAAIYQTARPTGAADVYYGTGAGRQF